MTLGWWMLDCTYLSKPTDLYATKSELNSYAILKKKKINRCQGILGWNAADQKKKYIYNKWMT